MIFLRFSQILRISMPITKIKGDKQETLHHKWDINFYRIIAKLNLKHSIVSLTFKINL